MTGATDESGGNLLPHRTRSSPSRTERKLTVQCEHLICASLQLLATSKLYFKLLTNFKRNFTKMIISM